MLRPPLLLREIELCLSKRSRASNQSEICLNGCCESLLCFSVTSTWTLLEFTDRVYRLRVLFREWSDPVAVFFVAFTPRDT